MLIYVIEKYEAKLEFHGGEGGVKQKPSLGGVWIFSGTTHYFFPMICRPNAKGANLRKNNIPTCKTQQMVTCTPVCPRPFS